MMQVMMENDGGDDGNEGGDDGNDGVNSWGDEGSQSSGKPSGKKILLVQVERLK